jgi:hypothetical protein
MPSSTQLNTAAANRMRSVRDQQQTQPVWKWVGWAPGKSGRVGIVADNQGRQQQGETVGNAVPRAGARVTFIPGNPIGSIILQNTGDAGGGGGIIPREGVSLIYGQGNPNGRLANQDDLVPWVSQGQYFDLDMKRPYVATPNADDSPVQKWLPAGTVVWDDAAITAYAATSGYYPGDIYQGPTDHGITDAEGGMFYRLSNSGSWVPQFTCCEPPSPPGAPCAPGWQYALGTVVYLENVYFPCP